MRINVSTDGNASMEEQLYFIPANNGSIDQGAWQKWDVDAGVFNIDGDTGRSDAMSLESYVVAHPDARIVNNSADSKNLPAGGGVTFQVGASGDNQRNGQFFLDDIVICRADALTGSTLEGTRFDLEPDRAVTDDGR